MHQSLLEDPTIGKQLEEENILLPRKVLGGSAMSTYRGVVEDRMIRLQAYLDKLLKVPGLYGCASFVVFCDFKNKGISGIESQLGREKVVKEAFASTKIGSTALFSKNLFIVLLKSGSILAFESKYDVLERAVCAISLLNDQVKVVPDCSSESRSQVTVSSERTNRQMAMKFESQLEAALWTKAIAQFSSVEPAFLAGSEDVRRSFAAANKIAGEKVRVDPINGERVSVADRENTVNSRIFSSNSSRTRDSSGSNSNRSSGRLSSSSPSRAKDRDRGEGRADRLSSSELFGL